MMLSIILWVLIGAATAYFAHQRGRDPYIWFAIGILLGLFGILILVLLPPVGSAQEKVEEPTPFFLESDKQPKIGYSVESKEWFYLDKLRQQIGPVQFETLKQQWEEGEIDEQTFVWYEGMSDWKQLNELPETVEKMKNE